MDHLESLNSFFFDRLMAAAAEIFEVVKDTVCQYQEEIERSKQENVYLRKMLAEVSINNEAGAQSSRVPPEWQNSTPEAVDLDTSLIQVKLEVSTLQQDVDVQQEMDAPAHHAPSDSTVDVTVKLEDNNAQVASKDDLTVCPENTENESHSQLEPNPQSEFSNLPFHLQSPAAEKLFRSKVRRKPQRCDLNLKGRKLGSGKGKKLRCDLCGKWYSSPHSLKIHLRTHTGERPFPCKFCIKTFHQKAHLKEHERTHTGEKPYSCSACGKRFSRAQQSPPNQRGQHDPITPASVAITRMMQEENSAFLSTQPTEPPPAMPEVVVGGNKKKRCEVCGPKTDRKTQYTCIKCRKYICNSHTVKLCPSCVV